MWFKKNSVLNKHTTEQGWKKGAHFPVTWSTVRKELAGAHNAVVASGGQEQAWLITEPETRGKKDFIEEGMVLAAYQDSKKT